MTKYQVSVAAEAIVASLLAQAGCDVSVQYGAHQPGYDLVACRNDRLRKVSVKGSNDDRWMLALGYMESKSTDPKKYLKAIEAWRKDQDPDTVFPSRATATLNLERCRVCIGQALMRLQIT